jgi:perosamine synthetase
MRHIGVGNITLSKKAKQYVNEAMDTNRLSYGPFSQRFEKEFAEMHDSKFAVVSNSGTSALQMALATLKNVHGWEDGDEVIVPATTFIATSNIVIFNNMVPIFVDVDPVYYELDPEKIEDAITLKTRCIIPVHLFGQPADMDPIREIAGKHNLLIMEDSAETMLAKYKGKSVGALSEIGSFSTYSAHILTTGVGGVNTTNNPDYAVMLRSLANHGRDNIYISIDDDKGKSGDELATVIARRFQFTNLGFSYRLTEFETAVGCAQLEELPDMVASRRKNAAALSERLKHYGDRIQVPAIREGCDHSFMMYPLVLRKEAKVEMVNFLEENGIETRDMLPLVNQPIYKKLYNINPDDYPVSKWIVDSGFYIGCHNHMTEDDVEYVAEVIGKFFKR